MTESNWFAWCLVHKVWIGPAIPAEHWITGKASVHRPDNNKDACACPDDSLDIRLLDDPPDFTKEVVR